MPVSKPFSRAQDSFRTHLGFFECSTTIVDLVALPKPCVSNVGRLCLDASESFLVMSCSEGRGPADLF